MPVFECFARIPKFLHIYESRAFEFSVMHFYFCLYILYVIGGRIRPSILGGKGFPSQKPSLSVLTKVPPMICARVFPDSCWIYGEPSGQKSNVFGPLELLVGKICLAMARTNRWEWTGWGGQIECWSGMGKYQQGVCWNIVISTFQSISAWRRTWYIDVIICCAVPKWYDFKF